MAGEWVYFPQGLQRIGRKLVINKSTTRPIAPVDHHSGEWGDGFPQFAQWFDHLFNEPIQLDYFLAWARSFYRDALAYKPSKGVSLFIAGPVGRGKTFLSDKLVSTLMGGHYDIGDHLVDGGNFANGCYDYGLWTVGDARPNQDWRSKQQYTARLKKWVANREFSANEKYQKAYMTQWMGRIVVTCNDDPVSIQLLPDLDQSTSDKVTFLRIAKESIPVPPGADDLLDTELPHLAGWLLATKDAEYVEQDARFGQRAFHDYWMKATVQASGRAQVFEETLVANTPELCTVENRGVWTGNATELFKLLANADGATMREHSPDGVGRMLTQLLSLNRPYVSFKRDSNKRQYTIDTKRLAEYQNESGELPEGL